MQVQGNKDKKGVDFNQVDEIYETIQGNVDTSIDKMFDLVSGVTTSFNPIIMTSAIIYLSLIHIPSPRDRG